MKKILSLFLAIIMLLSMAACTESNSNDQAQGMEAAAEDTANSEIIEEAQNTEEAVTIKVAGLKGPTSMGMIKLIDDCSEAQTTVSAEFTLAGSADEITPKLIQGELDMAAVPANLASVLYNNTNGQIKVMAVNTLGVLYIVEKGNSISSVADLKGKTIYATGKGSTPEYTLRYILQNNGIDPDNDVSIEYKSEPTEVLSILAESDGIAMLPQPYVTVAESKLEALHTVLNLTEEWDKLETDSSLITGVLVARAEFLENYPNAAANFLSAYEDSVNWVLENNDEAVALIGKYDIVAEAVAKKALPYCNICFMKGDEMQKALSGYLECLFNQNPKAVGGSLPQQDFYYR